MKKIKILITFLLLSLNLLGQVSVAPIPETYVKIDSIDDEYNNNYYEDIEDEKYNKYYQKNETLLPEERSKTINRNRSLPESFKENYTSSSFDYNRVEEKPKDIEPPNLDFLANLKFLGGFIKIFLYLFLGILLIVIIYLIIKNVSPIYFNGKEKNKSKYSTETEESDLDEIDNNNFEQLINKAKIEQNYTLATRYYYLWVLQKLSNKKLILWHKDKTDNDYYLELNTNKIQTDFSNCLYIYDHIWYGKFPINYNEFTFAEKLFNQTLNKI